MSAVESRLTQALNQKCNAVLSGSITTLGRREFYFYGTTPEQLESSASETRKVFRGYKFERGSHNDPNWLPCCDVLFPPDEEFERVKNRKVSEVLKANGDLLKDSREITHWAYFKIASDRQAFKKALQPLGYKIESESDDPNEEYPLGICLVRRQSVNASEMEDATPELFRVAQKFQGSYDGWETRVNASQS